MRDRPVAKLTNNGPDRQRDETKKHKNTMELEDRQVGTSADT